MQRASRPTPVLVAALFARNAGAGGQHVRVDAAETAAAMCFPYVLQNIYNGTDRRRGDQDIPAGQVMCRDGWVCIWVYNHRFAGCMQGAGAAGADRAIRASPSRPSAGATGMPFSRWCRRRSPTAKRDDVVASLQAAQVIAAKAYRPSELRQRSASRRARLLGDHPHDGEARRVLGPPFRMSLTPRQVGARTRGR